MATILNCKMAATRGANMLSVFFPVPLGCAKFHACYKNWTILVDMWYLPLYYFWACVDRVVSIGTVCPICRADIQLVMSDDTIATIMNSVASKWHWLAYVPFLWFLPARRYASAGNSDRNVSVCPSVCLSVFLSVTRRYCVKTKKASGMISSPSGSHKTLVFWRQISSPNSKGFPPNGSLKHGSVEKIQRFFSFKRLYLENGSRYGQSYY